MIYLWLSTLSYTRGKIARCLCYTDSNMPAKSQKARTYARNRVFSRKGNENVYESDGQYFLKLVLCIVLGTVWIKFSAPLHLGVLVLNGLPLGLAVGLLVVNKFEKFQFNRKIWYALLVLVTIVSFFLPSGIVI